MYFPAFLRKNLCYTVITITVVIPLINVGVDPTDLVPHPDALAIKKLEMGCHAITPIYIHFPYTLILSQPSSMINGWTNTQL